MNTAECFLRETVALLFAVEVKKKKTPLRPLSKKKCMNETVCPFTVCGASQMALVIVMHSVVVFFPAAAALCCRQFKLFKQSAGGASEHLKCDLACESTQTALAEIRLVEHDWSQTSNLRELAASRGTDSPRRARLKRISDAARPPPLPRSQPGSIAGLCCS